MAVALMGLSAGGGFVAIAGVGFVAAAGVGLVAAAGDGFVAAAGFGFVAGAGFALGLDLRPAKGLVLDGPALTTGVFGVPDPSSAAWPSSSA